MKQVEISETRQRIVDTASRLFYTQGYNSTGINQIIDEAGVAKASLYQYFPSKEDLLAEYLNNAAVSTNDALSKAIAKYNKPKEKVLAVFDFLVKTAKEVRCEGCNFLNILSEVPVTNNRIRGIIKREKEMIRKIFADILEPAGREDLADSLYLLFDGALIGSKVHGNVWPILTAKTMADKLV